MREIHLHIDRITVDGLSLAEQRGFTRAVEAELRALAEGGGIDATAASPDRAIRTLSAGQLQPGATGTRAAAQVAESVRNAVSGRARAGTNARGREVRRHG